MRVFGGIWGCFARTFVVFWRDFGGKHGSNKLKKHVSINVFELLRCIV